MSLPGPQFTYEDYKLMPEDKRCEILEGDLLMTPAPSARHQRILMRIAARLDTFAAARRLGEVFPAPTDVILSPTNVVQPDILFVAANRLGIIDPAGGIQGPPDLVVEILSPGTASLDQVVKRKLYGKYGVREYWIVDPAGRSVEVLAMTTGGLETWRVFPSGTNVTSPQLTGLAIPVDEVFAE